MRLLVLGIGLSAAMLSCAAPQRRGGPMRTPQAAENSSQSHVQALVEKKLPALVKSAAGPAPVPLTGFARLALVGDIMLARGIASRIERHGIAWPIELVSPLLASADLAAANLESPAGDNPIPYLEKSVLFRARPKHLDVLAQAGIDLVSLSNNHILDYGPGVAGRTEAELKSRGIAYSGLIRQSGEAPRVDLVVRGLKIAFLSYCSVCHEKFQLKGSAPGSAPGIIRQMRPHVRKAKQESDFVIVAMHWGQEYYGVNALQRKLAAVLAAAGADIIVGHHAHVVQKVERIGKSLVFYGLGNFIFDQRSEITQDSALALVTLRKGKSPNYEIIPVTLKEGRPRPLEADEEAYSRIKWITKQGYQYDGKKDYPEFMRQFKINHPKLPVETKRDE